MMAGIKVLAFYSGVRKREGIGLVSNNLVMGKTMLRVQLLTNIHVTHRVTMREPFTQWHYKKNPASTKKPFNSIYYAQHIENFTQSTGGNQRTAGREKRTTISPTIPRRNANTHTIKMKPVTIVTDSPIELNHSICVTDANQLPKSPKRFSSAMMIIAPMIGPTIVPKPPTRVINTTRPDIVQCTSVSVSKPSTAVFVAPAKPANAADSTNTSSLYLSTS